MSAYAFYAGFVSALMSFLILMMLLIEGGYWITKLLADYKGYKNYVLNPRVISCCKPAHYYLDILPLTNRTQTFKENSCILSDLYKSTILYPSMYVLL